jgi:site-specific DNA-methyltransferase (adenine-specific)
MSKPWKRKEVIGDCTLYLGDALDLLPHLQDTADCLCTDAPYLVSKGGFASNNQLEGGFGGWMKDYGNGGDIVQCEVEWSDWMPLAYATLKNDRQAYFMTNGRNLSRAQTAAESAGFDLHTLLVWDKKTALPNKYYQNITEFTLFMKKGRAFTINDPSSKNLVSLFQRDETKHPTEKPVELMQSYIGNSTQHSSTVIDPFMGSGTTGVACVRMGRKFIGLEKDPRWFDVAVERIASQKQPDMIFLQQEASEQLSIFDGAA